MLHRPELTESFSLIEGPGLAINSKGLHPNAVYAFREVILDGCDQAGTDAFTPTCRIDVELPDSGRLVIEALLGDPANPTLFLRNDHSTRVYGRRHSLWGPPAINLSLGSDRTEQGVIVVRDIRSAEVEART